MRVSPPITPAFDPGLHALDRLPLTVQVLFSQIQKADTESERRGCFDRMAAYLKDFTQHDINPADTAALNQALAPYQLGPVTAPVSANQAAFERLTERAASTQKRLSSFTGRYQEIDGVEMAKRQSFIAQLQDRVRSYGASLTNAELADAARILELGLRGT